MTILPTLYSPIISRLSSDKIYYVPRSIQKMNEKKNDQKILMKLLVGGSSMVWYGMVDGGVCTRYLIIVV